MNSTGNPEAAFLQRNAESLQKIAIFADLSEGFTVGFVEVALERDCAFVIQALTSHSDDLDVQWIPLKFEQPDLRYLIAAITTALESVERIPDTKVVLLVCGLERAIGGYGDYPPLLSNINIARDTYVKKLPYPMLFLLPSYAINRFARFAPDFWAWKSIEVRLQSDLPPHDQAVAALSIIADPERVMPVAQERFDLLYRLLQDYRQPSPTRADLLNQLGHAYESHLNYPKAEQAYQEALNFYETLTDSLDQAETLNNLAELYYAMGRCGEAEPLFTRSLAIREQQLGADHPNTAASLNNLAVLYYAMGRCGEAEPLFTRSLLIREQQLGDNHPDTATSLNNLAGLYQAMGRYAEAEPLSQRSLAIREQQLGADHPNTAQGLNNLAGLYQAMGRYAEAEPLFQRSLLIREQQLGADHPDTAASLNNLAALYQSMGRYGEAEPLSKRSLAICEQQLGADHPDTANSLNNLAALYYAMGRYQEAEPLYHRSLLIREQQLGADHPDTASSLNNLAALYRAMGRYAEAEPLYMRSLAIWRQGLGETHPNTKTAWSNFCALIQQAVQSGRAGELSAHPITQAVLEQVRGEA